MPQLPATSRPRPRVVLASLVALSVIVCGVGLVCGHGDLDDPAVRDTLLRLRGHRVFVAYLAGASLAMGGVLVQGLFRNPLASPSILGTSAGATVGAQTAMLTHQLLIGWGVAAHLAPEMFAPAGAVLGALTALGLLLAVTRDRRDPVLLLLTGFLLSSMFLSLGALVTSLAQQTWELGRAIMAFTLGGIGGAGPRQSILIAITTLASTIAARSFVRPLDLMLSGWEEAQSLGVDTRRVRRWAIVWTAILTAGAVSVGGNVTFVGLIVPHAARRLVGVGHRVLLPCAALGGGCFLVVCDLVTRVVPSRTEIPLGVLTGLIGAPLFLMMLLEHGRQRRGGL